VYRVDWKETIDFLGESTTVQTKVEWLILDFR
jgi:hypothetical protein